MAGGATASRTTMYGLFLCALYVAISATMIHFNKYIMKRFPYAMVLTSLHMTASSLSSVTLYALAPSLFPAMTRVKERMTELPKYFVGLGLLFGISLYTSNQAYLYCSVSFLQFMKETNVVLIFMISCAIGLQILERQKVFIVMWIVIGSSLCVKGEIHFVLTGFIVQGISQISECGKNVLGEYLLTKCTLKLDPLTYVLFMAPVALIFLSIGVVCTWDPQIPAAMLANWMYLLPNAFCAVGLNVVIALVLKECSAMGFILAGVVKDILIVLASAFFFSDTIAPQQWMGFVVALSGCAAWSMLKVFQNAKQAETLPLAKQANEGGGYATTATKQIISKKLMA